MANPYVVIRLVPDSPVDGATFATYLDNLALQVYDANTGEPISDLAYASPLTVLQWPPGSGPYWSYATEAMSASTQYASGNYGDTLQFDSVNGISVGSYVYSADGTTISGSLGLTVKEVTQGTASTPPMVQLSSSLSSFVPAGTVVSFAGLLPGMVGTPSGPNPSFTLQATGAQQDTSGGPYAILDFATTAGVTIGMMVSGPSITAANQIVLEVNPTTVTISNPITDPVSPGQVTFTLPDPYVTITCQPTSASPAKPHPGWTKPYTLNFPTPAANKYEAPDGVPVGALLIPIPGLVLPGTTVTQATDTTLVISPPLKRPWKNTDGPITLVFPLSNGIVQHTEALPVTWKWDGFNIPVGDVVIPAAVATAVIQLNEAPPPPNYLDIKIRATRGTEVIPETSTYYNVQVLPGDTNLQDLTFLYQQIPATNTSLYLVVPPTPGASTVSLAIPPDGSAPPFDALLQAIESAMSNDPIKPGMSAAELINSTAWCTRIAYDIVWSFQNDLPLPPDALESLYTNPPNPGGGGTSTTTSGSNNSSTTSNLEMDRQKFEGELSSFYATRNASAERLTKFVAAASAALACEQISANAPTALLEFPVDPSAPFASAVESEILLGGLGVDGASGLSFAVPAAFFYALGAGLDKSSTVAQRHRLATGDAAERLVQQFAAAVDANVIKDSESFSDPTLTNPSPVTSFQAVRRLTALAVPATSTSSSVTVLAGSPLAALVSDWLAATDPSGTQNPPPTYQNDDFTIWSQTLGQDTEGYLDLDLDALTQAYVIPPFAASPTAAASSGTSLTFGPGSGIGVGMPVSGPGIAVGTTVQSVTFNSGGSVTVVLSAAVTDVTTSTVLVFNFATAPVTAKASPSQSGQPTLSLSLDATTGISAGMTVLGAGIAPATTVTDVTTGGVTLSTAATVQPGATITFVIAPGSSLSAVTASTTGSSAGSLLTFAPTTGISVGMSASGTYIPTGTTVPAYIPAGTTVWDVTTTAATTTVTLSADITPPMPNGSTVTFALAAGGPLPTVTAAATSYSSATRELTFSGPGGTGGISAGMSVIGTGIPAGAFVQAVSGSTVTLNAAAPGIQVPANFTFAFLPSTLADQIRTWLPTTTSPPTASPTVATLKQVTAAGWTGFFSKPGYPQWLPPFTQPVAPGASSGSVTLQAGYVAARTRAFVRAVQQFFTVSTAPTAAALPPAGSAPTFEPVYDPIQLAAGDMPSPFTFGSAPLNQTDLGSAAKEVFPGDDAAQAWLKQAMTTINELWEIAGNIPNPNPTPDTRSLPYPASFAFSVMEALYARGFRSAADILALSEADFGQSLIGTVAYGSHTTLYANAGTPAAPTGGQPAPGFQPVNPDGSLVDCIPPPCLSPTGPIAYLQEMLTLTPGSTCDDLAGSGTTTLGTMLTQRRRPLGDLVASCANLETPIPLIDLVNECLEYLGTATTPVYSTAEDVLAGYALAPAGAAQGDDADPGDESCAGDGPARRHDPARLLAVLPEHSTPATPDQANAAVEPTAFNNLKGDFSSCALPYSQALDVSRTYLGELGSSRFEEMRTFRRCITEFVLDPTHEPAGFQSWLWRYPVRIDTAIEYLGITPEEYAHPTLFNGAATPPCVPSAQSSAPPSNAVNTGPQAPDEPRFAVPLPQFLADTCLSYCEFYELWKSGFVQFQCGTTDTQNGNGAGTGSTNGASTGNAAAADTAGGGPGDGQGTGNGEGGNGQGNGPAGGTGGTDFPECEPCCPESLWLQFPAGQEQQDLAKLQVFVRLWRKLRESCHGGYSFAELRDICDVLIMQKGDAANPDFIRQLVAFQMLRDDFGLELTDPATPIASGAIDENRTHLLALWVDPTAAPAPWSWAVRQLITRVEEHLRRRHGRDRRSPEFVKLLTANLDPLSRLAGFDPDSTAGSWHAYPTNTLRFAEVLSKVYASRFTVGELIYLFTADPHLDGDDPFPLQDENEALDAPLGLPDDDPEHGLWRLRRELLDAEVGSDGEDDGQGEGGDWPWRRIETALQTEFGFAAGDVTLLAQHFFPGVLTGSAGQPGTPSPIRFVSKLATTSPPISPSMWNDPPDGPFQYDSVHGELSACIPLSDRAVIAKLTQVHDLITAEQLAVQDLYFQPRAMLAGFALLFPDFTAAQRALIEEPDEARRFAYFRRHFLACRRRRWLIASHLARHVTAVTGEPATDEASEAELILRTLAADENAAGGSWEDNSGAPPKLTWALPRGGALAALLGLTGTGLTVEYAPAGGPVAWRDYTAGLAGFGDQRDRENCPVPTVLPSFTAMLTPQQMQSASVHNGFLMRDSDGTWLGGAQAFSATWSGALLIEHEGTYEFWGGAPTPGDERPDLAAAEHRQWRVTLRRGQRGWVILSHHWPGEEEHPATALPLKRGAYEVTAELIQPGPDFGRDEELRAQHTGFQVKYCGPDSEGRRTVIPHTALFAVRKDQPPMEIDGLGVGAAGRLVGLYTSSLRDIRRTYQRAFKAALLCRRLGLSAKREPHGTSELGHMLTQSQLFAGVGYFGTPGAYTPHAANLDFDFLPVLDDYWAPASGTDQRTAPSPQRVQAMFDWCERLFDYAAAREDVHRRSGRWLWHLFDEAQEKQPANPGYLLRQLGADARRWQLDLRYFQGQGSPAYEVTSADLSDERWTLRAWHADRWLSAVQRRFAAGNIEAARPDQWASDDPSSPLSPGNANLVAFVADGCLENSVPCRYEDLRRLNDQLRERGRRALIAYLCSNNHVQLPWQSGLYATKPADLSDLLLLDVEAGLREKASRIEEAITAAQSFIRRSRLGLEPGWKITREFARLWDSRYETYRTWERARRRELYRENWIEWDELRKARRIKAFEFLEARLRSSALTLAAPGGLNWWPDDGPVHECTPELLQRQVPSELLALPQAPEGLTMLGRPEFAAQPSWLAVVPQPSATGTGTGDGNSSGSSGTAGTQTQSGTSGTPVQVAAPTALGTATGGTATGDVTLQSLATTAASGGTQPQSLPLWMESAIKLGTQFVRVAAAGAPPAALGFVPHGEEPHGEEPPCEKPSRVCCRECGCEHPAEMDEYYFWLIDAQVYTEDTDSSGNGDPIFTGNYQLGFQDSYYDQFQQQSAEWDDEDVVPALLAKWKPGPAVRLAWCRVHNGEFMQPRRSTGYVAIDQAPGLTYLGRLGDSLYLEVTGATTPPGYDSAGSGNSSGDTSPPGFRYDLPRDEAVALPQVLMPKKPTTSYPGGLPSYPFFAYFEPGARLFPASWFAPALAVAGALRARCDYDLALRWYRRAFDPLQQDCTWVHCSGDTETTTTVGITGTTDPTGITVPAEPTGTTEPTTTTVGVEPGGTQTTGPTVTAVGVQPSVAVQGGSPAPSATPTNGGQPARPGGCCDASCVTQQAARNRAVTLLYCRTLVEAGDALMRCRRSPEAFQQARIMYDTAARITGVRPRSVLLPESASPATVTGFVPAYAPLNPQLMELYDVIADRLELVHRSVNAERIRNGRPGRDMPYFGDGSGETPRDSGGCSCGGDCCDDEDLCCRPSPYRFLAQIPKAIELASRVREMGAVQLAAHEKGDAEYLASIHAEQEREMLALGIAIRQDEWRDADWQVQALQQTKDLSQVELLYYVNLYQNGLLNDEIQNQDLTTYALAARTSANETEAEGEIMNLIPDPFVGAVSSGTSVPVGSKIAHVFQAVARIMQAVGDIFSTTAGMDLTQAGWERRAVEWLHQMQKLPIDIQKTELEILGAHRRRDKAMRELNNQQRQLEHSAEVLDFLRDKFTAADLYLWLQREALAVHRQMYLLAWHKAREAQRCFNFDLGYTHRRFLPEEGWDNLHEGLMAGERLELALRRMETAYYDENRRELELTKHFSLRQDFPLAYMELRITGRCQISIEEWRFDLDHPGHWLRRTKDIAVTVPCVAGPYTGVHCRLTLLSSVTRISPELRPPAQRCCCSGGREHDEYQPCLDDPRFVHEYDARESIATSSGQNDSGLFELSFRDERYLPFEYRGAAARMLIEVPFENNYFDPDTMTDFVLHHHHTARPGGPLLREAATRAARGRLPGDGLRFFDVRHDFPDAWPALRESGGSGDRDGVQHRPRRLRLHFTANMFPFVPGRPVRTIDRLMLVFAAPDAEPGRRHLVRFRRDDAEQDTAAAEVECVASDGWPGYFRGTVDMRKRPLGPLRDGRSATCTFEIPQEAGEIRNVFVLAGYDALPRDKEPWSRTSPGPEG